jgi:hypothetical protein
MEERFSRNSDRPQLLALGLGTHLLQPSALPQVDCMTDPITRLNAALEGRYRIESELGEESDG